MGHLSLEQRGVQMTDRTDSSTEKSYDFKKERAAWTIDEGAHLLSVGRTTIYKLHAAGKIRLIKIGRRRLIPNTEIIRISENGI
jgi:excisionase family DNA binding protein